MRTRTCGQFDGTAATGEMPPKSRMRVGARIGDAVEFLERRARSEEGRSFQSGCQIAAV